MGHQLRKTAGFLFGLLFFTSFITALLLFPYKIVLALTPLTAAQQQTIDFLIKDQKLDLPYTKEEIAHLQDVQNVMQAANYLFYLSALILGVIIYLNYKNNRHQNNNSKKNGNLLQKLRTGSSSALIVLVLVLIFILLDFDSVFTMFHQVFFPQGNWQFAADSLLIQTFPLPFFTAIGLKIFLLTALLSGSIYFIVRKLK